MRILHTSDWHIGNSFFSFNRDEEFRFFIKELSKIVKENNPDILVIAGDIYDNANPTLSARRLFTESLISLCSTNPEMKIIATAGNHDSGSNLEVFSPLFKEEITVVGRQPVIKRYQTDSETGAVIVAVPFVSENGFRCRFPLDLSTCDNPRKEYFGFLLKQAKEMACPNDVIILVAHEAVSNSDFTGQERYNFNFCSLDSLSKGYNYLALGHIHRPQTLNMDTDSAARYSGSPLPMGFDESFDHSVTIVDFSPGKPLPEIQSISIPVSLPMLTLPREKPIEEDEAIRYVESLVQDETKGYLRLRVNSSRPLPSLTAKIRNLCAESGLRFCMLKIENEDESSYEVSTSPENRFSVADLHTVDPLTLALSYYKRKTGRVMDEKMRRCLYEIISETPE